MDFQPGTPVLVFDKYSGVVKKPSHIKVDPDMVRVEYFTDSGTQIACYLNIKDIKEKK